MPTSHKLTSTERVNIIGFSLIYLLSTYLGSGLIVLVFFGISAIFMGFPLSFYLGSPVIGNSGTSELSATPFLLVLIGIVAFLLGTAILYGLSKVLRKISSVKTFAVTAFFTLLITHIIGFQGFFTIDHHVLNPAFYALVLSYLALITCLLTYIWKVLILENSKTSFPWKVYGISLIIVAPAARFILLPLADSYTPFHDFLFKHFLINIYFLDWSGYWEILGIMTMLITLAVVTKLLHGNK
jgi:hypothetical protein